MEFENFKRAMSLVKSSLTVAAEIDTLMEDDELDPALVDDLTGMRMITDSISVKFEESQRVTNSIFEKVTESSEKLLREVSDSMKD